MNAAEPRRRALSESRRPGGRVVSGRGNVRDGGAVKTEMLETESVSSIALWTTCWLRSLCQWSHGDLNPKFNHAMVA